MAAQRSIQRARVLKLKDDIMPLLNLGLSMVEIQRRIGLEDMPNATFYYHASRLRDAANISPYATTPVAAKPSIDLPSSAPTAAAGKPAPEDEPPSTVKQPERALEASAGSNTDKKRAPRKRRTQGIVPESQDAKTRNLDPSKWKTTL